LPKCEFFFNRYWITRVVTETGVILNEFQWKDKETAEAEYNRLRKVYINNS